MDGESAVNGPVATLTELLVRSLRSVGEQGRPEHASRWAAAAWVVLRDEWPRQADRMTGVLHYLTQLAAADVTPPTAKPVKERDMYENTLDVRDEPPARRHELIFDTYGTLSAGQAFVLVNDHDPKPLYYQFAAEHSGQFSWDYLEQGPQVWRVRIGRPATRAVT